MASMLEVLREYRHLAAQRKSAGGLPPALQSRFEELEALVRSQAPRGRTGDILTDPPTEHMVTTPPARALSGSASPPPRGFSASEGQARTASQVVRPAGRAASVTVNPSSRSASRARSVRATPAGAAGASALPAAQKRNPSALPAPRDRGVSVAPVPRERTSSLTSGAPGGESQANPQSMPAGPGDVSASIPSLPPPGAVAASAGAHSVDLPSPGAQGPAGPTLYARERQPVWAWLAVALLFSLGLVLAVAFGLAEDGGLYTLIRGFLTVGIGTWGVLYPALMAWREWSARRRSAHLSEPDFRATTPVVEPFVAVTAALAAVLWLQLGGYSEEGLPRLLGYLTGLAGWLGALGWGAALVVRPLAARYARTRAFSQYLKGGVHAYEKKNTKRARRMFELALAEADSAEEEQQALRRLEEACEAEAEELRMRGWHDRADELLNAFQQTLVRRRRRAVTPTGAAKSSAPPVSQAELPASQPPRLLAIGDVHIDHSGSSTEKPEVRRVAELLASRGRNREAVEHLVTGRLGVPPDLAKAAAQEYIQQGLLRSADTLYDALGEPQIPEFYKAVAVEWNRQESSPPQPVLRLAKLLEGMGETQVAARISCQGVLSGLGPADARRNLASLAVELCRGLGQEPPAEILEAVDQLIEAGDAFRRAGDDTSARRCYQALAERLISQPDQRELLVPVLNRMFNLDKFLEDRFMVPLVEDVIESRSHGPQALRVLMTYRARHREDHRVAVRLFELLVHEGQAEDALKLLRQMSLVTGSNPDSVLQHFETLRRRFPDDLRIEVGRVRALVKASRVQEAAQNLQSILPLVRDERTGRDVVGLIDSVFEWGHPDPELRNAAGQVLARIGDEDAALTTLEQYVAEGGRDPAALDKVSEILGGRLAHANGGPNYAVHLRLARFNLTAGAPQDAIPFLEIARASTEFRVEADLLLARAEVAASNPRRAVQILRDAIDGRHPRETPELHYELARVYDVLGERKKARQIDNALEEYAPAAVRGYQGERPILDKRDTEWSPGHHASPIESGLDTDVGDPQTSATEAAGLLVEEEDIITLEEALAPRYQLSKRLGAGGMGDVHLARDEVLGRPVAIKVLRRTLATDLFISKFRDEARIVAKLSHPGIVSVYDIGQKEDWSYIVMEYVRGPNLSALVNASAPPSRSELIQYVAAVADAMSYAHEQGVIHRDLKPANILIGHDGKVKVTDFGIAHVLHGDGGEETAFSAAGLQVGTVNYMAPEQLQGKAVDARTDIYLLGTTLYYTLCRRYPFMGEAVAVRKLREAPMPLTRYVPDLSPELEDCVQNCLSRDPKDRFQKMEELALVLRMVPEAQA